MATISKDRRHAVVRQLVLKFPTIKDNMNELIRRFWIMEGGYDLQDVDKCTPYFEIVAAYNDIRHQFEPSVSHLERQKQVEEMYQSFYAPQAV